MMIEPCGHRVVVKCDALEEVEQAELAKFEKLREMGLEIASGEDKKRKQSKVHTGVIVGIGENAWKAFDDGEPWAKLGDHVSYATYGGWEFEHNGEMYRLLNDEDVTGRVVE